MDRKHYIKAGARCAYGCCGNGLSKKEVRRLVRARQKREWQRET